MISEFEVNLIHFLSIFDHLRQERCKGLRFKMCVSVP